MRSLLGLALILAGAWSAGAPAGWLHAAQGPLEARSLRLTLGLGTCATLSALLAFAGFPWLMPWMLGAFALVGLLPLLRAKGRGIGGWERPSLPEVALLVLVALALLLGATPLVEGDTLTYHLPIVRHVLTEGRLRYWPAQWMSVFPMSHELLAANILHLGGERLGLLTGVEFALAAALLVALGERWLGDRRTAVLGSLIGLAGLAPIGMACSLKPDLLLLDGTLACALVVSALRPGDWKGALLAGAYGGLMIGSKYLGLPLAAALFVNAALRLRSAKALCAAAGAGLLLGGSWYAANALQHGNPFPPMWAWAFGPFFTPKGQLHFDGAIAGWGEGRGLLDLLLAPARMFLHSERFGAKGNLVDPLAFLGLFGFALPRRDADPRPRPFWLAVSAFGCLYLGWFFSLENMRHLLPGLALLAPFAAQALCRLPRLLRGPAWMALALLLGLPLFVGAVTLWRARLPRDAYLEARTPFYGEVQWMNAYLDPRSHRVASLHPGLGLLEVPWMPLNPYYQTEIPAEHFGSPALLADALAAHGFTHLFASRSVIEAPGWNGLLERLRPIRRNPEACECGKHLFRADAREETVLYEIPAPEPAAGSGVPEGAVGENAARGPAEGGQGERDQADGKQRQGAEIAP